MDEFAYRDGVLWCEQVPVHEIAAAYGTPVYIYSRKTLEGHYNRFTEAFSTLRTKTLYSVKSCGNLSLLRILVQLGAGMDVVSGGELQRALTAGADPADIVFAGVGKSDAELRQVITVGVGWLNIESEAELETIERIARELGRVANVAVRINPDVIDARTHQHTATGGRGSKFGIDLERIEAVFVRFAASPHVSCVGLHFHLGSPIYSAEPYVRAIERVLALIDRLREKGHVVNTLDIGGGFMAEYDSADGAPAWDAYAAPIVAALQSFVDAGGRVFTEPGRTISANAGLLLTRVLYRKRSGATEIAVVDTGMHHLIRPALYGAKQFMWPARVRPEHVPSTRTLAPAMEGLRECDVVGPICESTDRLAQARMLPELVRNDLLAIFSTGAYGMVMASQYNAVPRPPEVLVEGDRHRVIRRRESYQDVFAQELDYLT